MSMELHEARLKKRDNGSEPQKNSIIGNIEERFSFSNRISFHFGGNDNSISPYSWKVLLTDHDLLSATEGEILDALVNFETLPSIKNDCLFLEKHGFSFSYIILNDNVDWKNERNIILKVDCDMSDNKLGFKVFKFPQQEFQRIIVSLFGRNLTNKPLIYSTTKFEGYLSDICVPGLARTDVSLFPGDVDLVLFNQSYQTTCLVEFKKHTPSGVGSIEDQSFLKYIGKDIKKYSTLGELSRELGKDYFFNVIYSTKCDELNKIKIEKVTNDLTLDNGWVLEFNSRDQLEDIFERYLR